ncbi:MAG: hypothetical protein AAF389_14980 [Gemmatimonadota bacterium]
MAVTTLCGVVILWSLAALPSGFERGYISASAFWGLPGAFAFVIPLASFVVGYRLRDRSPSEFIGPLMIVAAVGFVLAAYIHPNVAYEGWRLAGVTEGRAPFGPRTPGALMEHWAWLTANADAPYDFSSPFNWPPNYVMWMWATPFILSACTLFNGMSGWLWSRMLVHSPLADDRSVTVTLMNGRAAANLKLAGLWLAHAAGILVVFSVAKDQVSPPSTVPGLVAAAPVLLLACVVAGAWWRIYRAHLRARGRQLRGSMSEAELIAVLPHGRLREGDTVSLEKGRGVLASTMSEAEIEELLGARGVTRPKANALPKPIRLMRTS